MGSMTRRDAAYVILFVLGLISFYAVRFISEGAGWTLTSEYFSGAPGVVGFFMLSFGVYILVLLMRGPSASPCRSQTGDS